MPDWPEARSPYALLDELDEAADVLVLTYPASLEFFERFTLGQARALGATVTVISDALMTDPDPAEVLQAGVQYLDVRAVCAERKAFHPKLFVAVGETDARVAIGSGNLTVAGWHANAETWTFLRAHPEGVPDTISQVAGFLRGLADHPERLTLSDLGRQGLQRVAARLEDLPGPREPGPRILHSVAESILEQLPSPSSPVSQLVLFAPFHDARLDGARALLDRLVPTDWTVFVHRDVAVDGPALRELALSRRGRIAWISRDRDGRSGADDRYWHGKLAQWTLQDGRTFALTGSPNLSRPALLRSMGNGGNCELAILSEINWDLTPPEGSEPEGGLQLLSAPSPNREARAGGPVLLSAALGSDGVTIELLAALASTGEVQRYNATDDQWEDAGDAPAGHTGFVTSAHGLTLSARIRVVDVEGRSSRPVSVSHPERVLKARGRSRNRFRGDSEDLLGDSDAMRDLLMDLQDLTEEMRRWAALAPAPPGGGGGNTQSSAEARVGPIGAEVPLPELTDSELSLADYTERLGLRISPLIARAALSLPRLSWNVGATVDDDHGTLTTDEDTAAGDDPEVPADQVRGKTPQRGSAAAFERAAQGLTPEERRRFRRFVEQLVRRAPSYPLALRALTGRWVLKGIARQLWSDDKWPPLLAQVLELLGDPEALALHPADRRSAASVASVALAVLRTDVPRMSLGDPNQIRFAAAAAHVRGLVAQRELAQIADLCQHVRGLVQLDEVEYAVDELLAPPTGAPKAARALAEEYDVIAHVEGEASIAGMAVDGRQPEPLLALALKLAADAGPIFAAGVTDQGLPVTAAWEAPWLAVQRTAKTGATWGRAWNLPAGLAVIDHRSLPRPDLRWMVGERPPDPVADLLQRAEADARPIAK